jgi:hypothetical protein
MMDLPHFATIDKWTELSGVSRSVTYELIGSGKLVARKLGKRTLVDVQAGIEYLHSLPAATIRMGGRAA